MVPCLGYLSGKFGLAVDNVALGIVIQMENVITPTRKRLLWFLKGTQKDIL